MTYERRVLHYSPGPTDFQSLISDRAIAGCSFELNRMGGCGSGELKLNDEFADRSNIKVGDWIAFEYSAGDRWYMGRVEHRSATVPSGVSFQLEGMGVELGELFVGGFNPSGDLGLPPHRYAITDLFPNDPDYAVESLDVISEPRELVILLMQQYVVSKSDIILDTALVDSLTNPSSVTSMKFRGEESIKSIIKDLAMRAGHASWGVQSDGKFFYLQKPTTVAATWRIGRDIISLEETCERNQLYNRITLTGGYVYDEKINSSDETRGFYRWRGNYTQPESRAQFGERRIRMSIPWIRTAKDSREFAREFFRVYAEPTKRYSLEIGDQSTLLIPWDSQIKIEDENGQEIVTSVVESVRVQFDHAPRFQIQIGPDDPQVHWPEPTVDERWELPKNSDANQISYGGNEISFTSFGTEGSLNPPLSSSSYNASSSSPYASSNWSDDSFSYSSSSLSDDSSSSSSDDDSSSSSSPPPCNVAKDIFTGVNGTALSAHAMDKGTGWTEEKGTWKIQGNKAEPGIIATFGMALTSTTKFDVKVSAKITMGASEGAIAGIVFRAVDALNYYRVDLRHGENSVELYRFVNDNMNLIAGNWFPPLTNTIDTGDTYLLEVRCDGDIIMVDLDGVELFTTNDSTHNTATKHGLYSMENEAISHKFEDFCVEDYVDTTRPSVVLTTIFDNDDTPYIVEVAFNKEVTGLTLSDISVTNGTASNLSGSGKDYTYTVTSTGARNVTTSIVANAVSDSNDNMNTASNALLRIYNTDEACNIAEDIFKSIDEVRLAAHPMDKGTGWVEEKGTWTLYNDHVVVDRYSASPAIALTSTNKFNVKIGVDITIGSSPGAAPGAGVAGIVFRAVDASNYFYVFISEGPGSLELHLVENGSSSQVAVFDMPPVKEEDTFFLEVRCDGSIIMIDVDGVEKLVYEDSTYGIAKKHGLYTQKPGLTAHYFDDFCIGSYNDTTQPSVTLTTPENNVSGAFTVTATFSKEVVGFYLNDVSVTNGTASNLSSVEKTHTFTVTPTAAGAITISVAAGVANDSNANLNTASNLLNVTYAPIVCVAKDTFTDTNGTRLISHTIDTGGGWLEQTGIWNTQSNKAEPDNATPAIAIATTNKSNVKVSAKVIIGDNATSGCGIVFRRADATNYWFVQMVASLNEVHLYLRDINGSNKVASFNLGTVSTGTEYLLEARCDGDIIMIDVDGVERIYYENATHNTATQHGLYSWGSGTVTPNRYDDFCVENYTYTPNTTPCNQAKDVFIDINNTPLADHTMNTGVGWIEEFGSWDIQNDKAEADNATPAIALTATSRANVKVSAKIVIGDSIASGCGIVFRRADTTNYWFVKMVAFLNEVHLYRRGINGYNKVASYNLGSVSTGTEYLLEARCDGDIIMIDVDGVEKIIYEDSTYNTATQHGLYSWDSGTVTANRYDNFCIEDYTDTTQPTVILTTPNSTVIAAYTVTATFSKNVTGFALGDISVTNGIASNLLSIEKTHTFTVTPTAAGVVTISVAAGVANDSNANLNTASNALNVTYTPTACNLSSDTFTDTNGTALTAHTMDTGSGWVVDSGAWDIQNNKAECTTGMVITTTAKSDVKVEADFTLASAGGTAGIKIIFRWVDLNNRWMLDIWTGSGTVKLVRVVAGGHTTMGEISLGVSLGDSYKLTVRCDGSLIAADVDGVERLIIDDSAHSTATKHGMETYQGSGSVPNIVDNFCVEDYTDTTQPTLLLETPSNQVSAPYTVTATFGKPITGFALGDISVTNGTSSALTGSGKDYTFIITPTAEGDVTTSVAAGVATDSNNNTSIASNTLVTAYSLTLVHDTFTGNNGDAISGRTPDTFNSPGNTWVVEQGSPTIQNNKESAVIARAVIETNETDVDVSADLTFGDQFNSGGTLIVRQVDFSNYFDIQLSYNGQYIAIFERSSQGDTIRSQAAYNVSLLGTYNLRATLDNSNEIKVYVDGTLMLTYTTTIHANGTIHGVRNEAIDNGTISDTTFDNFIVKKF